MPTLINPNTERITVNTILKTEKNIEPLFPKYLPKQLKHVKFIKGIKIISKYIFNIKLQKQTIAFCGTTFPNLRIINGNE
jgi:hypothetical protein